MGTPTRPTDKKLKNSQHFKRKQPPSGAVFLWGDAMTAAEKKLAIEIKRARLKLYLQAERAILSGQSYEIEGLKLTRANLKDVRDAIAKIESDIEKLSRRKGARMKFVVPVDEFRVGRW